MSNNVNTQGNVKVPGRLQQTAIDEHGNLLPIACASDIYDDVSGKSQEEINAEQAAINEELRNATGIAPSREEEIEDPYALMFNGKQKVYLKKNVVESNGEAHNLLTQDMFYRYDEELEERVPATNSIFIIQYDFELAENIIIPENCVLEFDGGSLSNNSIFLQSNTAVIGAKFYKTKINSSNTTNIIIKNLSIDCDLDGNDKNILSFNTVSNLKIINTEIKNYYHHYIQDEDERDENAILIRNSNSILLDSVKINQVVHPYPLWIENSSDIILRNCDFDDTLNTTVWETGHKIWTCFHLSACENVVVEDSKFITHISNGSLINFACKNGIIRNCICEGGQGIDVGNESIYYPNFSCENIVIDCCVVKNAYRGVSSTATTTITKNVLIKDTEFDLLYSSGDEGLVMASRGVANITISGCKLRNVRTILKCFGGFTFSVNSITIDSNIVEMVESGDVVAMADGDATFNCVKISNNRILANNIFLLAGNSVVAQYDINSNNIMCSSAFRFHRGISGDTLRSVKFSDNYISVADTVVNINNAKINIEPAIKNAMFSNNMLKNVAFVINSDDGYETKCIEGNVITGIKNTLDAGIYLVDSYDGCIIKNNIILLSKLVCNTGAMQTNTYISNNYVYGYKLTGSAASGSVDDFLATLSYNNVQKDIPNTCSSAYRPQVERGTMIYDTDLNKPIWYKGNNVWVDATGTPV